MVNYLVAIDESENARAAFFTALSLIKNKQEDQLFLLGVVDDMKVYAWHSHGVPASMYVEAQDAQKHDCVLLLQRYARLAKAAGIQKYFLLIGVSNHVGEMICQTVTAKHIDCALVGRRGISKLKRMFVGSTSRYVVEHANCDVLVIKGEWGASEVHEGLKHVVQLEEEERQRRIAEQQNKERPALETHHPMETLSVNYDAAHPANK